ncbi:MAG: SH3 domain-containing protein, partial [Clostridia bacterium]|nr:SH3 domain-containing protein [Clostridia bacterium]
MKNTAVGRRNNIVKAVAVMLVFFVTFSLFFRPISAEEPDTPESNGIEMFESDIAGYVNVNVDNILNVRTGPSTEYEVVAKLPYGTVLELHGTVMSGDDMWYYVSFAYDTARSYGYCSGNYVGLVSAEDDPEFELLLDEQTFPESYRSFLRVLHHLHPNWIFKSFMVGLDWDVVLENEYKFNSNNINMEKPSSWKSLRQGAFNWDEDRWIAVSGSQWTCASYELIDFFIDPRNFLNDSQLFMFEQLTFVEELASTESVDKLLSGTFMCETELPLGDEDGEPITYAEAFVRLGREFDVNPLMLAARVRQEQGGSGTNRLISGTVPGYEGYYNYFNIEAAGSTNEQILENGLNEAVREGWTSPYLALKGGSKKVSQNYITKGQDTLYLQKYDVDGTYYGRYWHQYMQNVQAPSREGSNVRKTYQNLGMFEQAFTFKIPVYDNMPEKCCPCPTADGNPNYRLSKIAVNDYAMSPSFESGVFTYTLTLPASIETVDISAVPINTK